MLALVGGGLGGMTTTTPRWCPPPPELINSGQLVGGGEQLLTGWCCRWAYSCVPGGQAPAPPLWWPISISVHPPLPLPVFY
jgi:hypothetical protein